jgi:hypothetical protein
MSSAPEMLVRRFRARGLYDAADVGGDVLIRK